MKPSILKPLHVFRVPTNYYSCLRSSSWLLLTSIIVFLNVFSVQAQTVNFSFTQIAAGTDVAGPGRGLQAWINQWAVPYPSAGSTQLANSYDDYYRFKWWEIQNDDGTYTWTIFDSKINTAIAGGRKFDFAVMPMATSEAMRNVGGGNLQYPLFVHNQMQAESVKDWIEATYSNWVPDWNSNSYLTAWENLQKAIAAHIASGSYNGVPYSKVVNIVDIRGYGNFGEWHTYPWTGEVSAARKVTLASVKRIIDANLTAFPDNQSVIQHEAFGGTADGNAIQDPAAGYYALTAKNNRGEIGWRRDSWGWAGSWFPSFLESNTTSYNGVQFSTLIMNKWKVAPITGEPMQCCTTDGGNVLYQQLPAQAKLYHLSILGNGNLESPGDANTIANMQAAGKSSGYRIVLTGGSVPSTLTPGTAFTLNLNWQNIGLAPTYENWNVVYELRNASDVAVWSGNSSFALRLFLPQAAATTASDNFTIPTTVAAGSYKLVVVARDPNGYRKPLPLAISGRNADGSYPLGTVTVGAAGTSTNKAPTANAGSSQTITLPTSTATLSGSGTDTDGTISSYAWSMVSGPSSGNIQSPNTASTGLSALVAGTYTFRLTVTDNGGATGTADVIVTVNAAPAANSPPFVSAGNAASVTLPASKVTLTGTASDADGTVTAYAWTLVSGPAGYAFSTPTTVSTDVTGLVAGSYVFKLTVTDNGGATASANVTITVIAANLPPTVSAGSNITVILPLSSASLTGTASDVDGTIASYAWTKVSGPTGGNIATPAAAKTSVTALVAGTYVFKLTVTDNAGATASANVNVVVSATPINTPPTVSAGSAAVITLPTSTVTLTGTASDADGTIASYAWTKVSGPAGGTITTPATVGTTVTGLVAGTYVFKLTVTDNAGATASANVTVTVNAVPVNTPPTVSAGSNVTITLPTTTATLTGTASDADGTIASYAWTSVSGPAGGTITTPAAAGTTITGLVAGTYVFKLTATDNAGATASANVTVTVNAAPVNATPVNAPPTVSAGSNVTITLPTTTATLTGTASDADGTIASYAWTRVSGPTGETITAPASASTSITGLVAGSYVFSLTVTDNGGATASANVTVTVNAANVPPTASAGNDITVTLPANTATLSGSGTDADGSIASYAWAKISGPTGGNIASPKSAATNITGLVAGTYTYRLTVTDNNGATATSNVVVTVVAAASVNQLPLVNAGTALTITLPVNTATVTGTANDPDGTIASYAWTQMSGPATATLTSAATASTDVNGLQEGTYGFRLTVTDNSGATAYSEVQVTVQPAVVSAGTNRVPLANAGTDQSITLPVSTVALDGSASSDPDGSIVSWSWSLVKGAGSYKIADISSHAAISNLVNGTYEFQLTVTDNKGAISFDRVMVNVIKINKKAIVKVADTLNVALPVQNTTLDASASYDPDGTIKSYKWSFVNGPQIASVLSPDSSKTTVNNLIAGTYTFNVTVTDNDGAISNAEVAVVVSYSNTRLNTRSISVYPNPVQGITNVIMDSDVQGNANLMLTDINGSTVLRQDFVKNSGAQTLQVNMSNLRPGVYILTIQVGGTRIATKKLMKL